MKIFSSTIAVLIVALSFSSCSSHGSCPAYVSNDEKGTEFEVTYSQETLELRTENS